MALGAIGMAALLRRWSVPAPGCFVGGVVFMMSAHFVLHIAEGHLEWCVLGLMPWLMLCMLRFDTDRRFVIVAALLLSSVLTFGSVYIMAVYMPFLSLWAMLESIRKRSWRFALCWGGTVVLTILLSAVKLLPQLEFVHANPREPEGEGEGFSPIGFVHVFLDPRQALLNQATHDVHDRLRLGPSGLTDYDAATHKFDEFARSLSKPAAMAIYNRLLELGLAKWKWHEYGGYITYLGLALAVCGIVVSWRYRWPLYVSGFLATAIVLGNGSPIDLWALLQSLPLYSQLHVPSRFMGALVFVLAVAAAHGLGWLCRQIVQTNHWLLHVLIWYGIPLAIYFELALLGWNLFGDVFVGRPIQLPHHEQFALRYKTLESENPRLRGYLYPLLKSNSGVLEGYENLQVKRGDVRTVDDPNYRGEAYLENSKDRVVIRDWTMARVKVAFQVNAPDTLVLNQNYFKGWRAAIYGAAGSRQEHAMVNKSGLVSLAVQPGENEVEFYYLPRSFLVGVWISGVTVTVCALLLIASSVPPSRRTPQTH
jgi:hypothetical protein